jgi:putative spermidine/putrescine transport system substrate-binding protein
MTADNGRFSAAFLFALLSLASPLAGHAQTPESAPKNEAVDAPPVSLTGTGAKPATSAKPPTADSAEASDHTAPPHEASPLDAASQEKPSEAQSGVTGGTAEPSGDGKTSQAKAADEKPAAQKAEEEKPAEQKPAEPAAPAQAAEPLNAAAQEKPSQAQSGVTGGTGEPSSDGNTSQAKAADEKPAAQKAEEEKPAEQKPAEPAAPAQAAEQPPAAAPAVKAPVGPEEPKDAALTVASPGGGYGEAQERAVFRSFTADTGHKIEVVSNKGGSLNVLDALKSQGTADGPIWDVLSLDGDLAAKACDEGLLQRLDPAAVFGETDAAAARDDFIPGAIQPCSIASTVWSAAILFNKTAFPKGAPATAQDLFDTAKFPGKRALPKDGKHVLELALIADGVELGKVYETLSTGEGLSRALSKLERLRNDVIWWEHGQEPLDLLASGKASMAMAFSGRAFMAAAGRPETLGFIWDGQIYHFDVWAVPRNSRYPRTAREFINYAAAPDRLAAQTRWFPYGPARLSALRKVGKHAELDLELAPYTPTAPDNFKNALAFNGQWWAQHGSSAGERLKGLLKTMSVQPPEASAAKEAGAQKAEKKDEKGEKGEKEKPGARPKPRSHKSSHKAHGRNADRKSDGSKAKRGHVSHRRTHHESAKNDGRENGADANRRTGRSSRNDWATDGQQPERDPSPGRWRYSHEYMD